MIGLMTTFGVLMVGGGYIGYLKAQSKPSLIAGATSGLLAGLCAAITMRNELLGLKAFIALTVILALFFCFRTIKTAKFMPSGILMIVSIAAAAYTYFQL